MAASAISTPTLPSASAARVHHTFCRICESLCGLEVTVEEGRVTAVRPDEDHVATAGFGCPKGMKQHKLYDSPDRLRYVEKRVGPPGSGRFERIPWEQALTEIGDKLRQLRGDHGPDTIAMYVGTAAGFGVLHPAFASGFMTAVGSRSMYASATQDCASKFAVAREMYGFPFTQPFPDLEHTRCLIVVGANPVISKWSFLQVPNPTRHLRAIEERGGKVYFVDPRRTESAKVAGEHVFIRPDTDVFFYMSFLNELRAQDGIDALRASQHGVGLAEVLEVAAPWTAERTAEVTGIPAARLRELVTAYRRGTAAGGAALYCSTGVNMGSNGSLAFWIQEVINFASGNLDRRGGTLVSQGIIDFAAFGRKTGTLLRTDRSRVGDFKSVNDAFPGGVLADEILTPGKGQVRALFVTGGNPLITMPNAGRLREALSRLELLVTLDIFRTETGQLAHYVLPCTSPLQRPDLPFVFPLMLGLQHKPYLQATDAVVPPEGEQRDEATIYLDLCRAAGVPLFGSQVAQTSLELMREVHSGLHGGEQPSLPQKLLLSLLLRVTGQASFGTLRKHPHGVLRPGHKADDFLGKRVVTDDGKLQLAPPPLLKQAERLEWAFARELQNRGRFKLITRRAVTTHNSWTHNLADFVEGDRSTNYLYLHSEDARRLGLGEGDLADVTSRVTTVRVPVRHHDDLMPGTVALPHGWGHQHAPGLGVASRTQGVNVNLLAADGPEHLEPASGMAHLTGFLVDVRPAAGPRDVTSWSGLPASDSAVR